MEKATLAGDCFWCMESPFEKLKGAQSAVSGYTGGTTKNPTYEDVCSGKTGHLEAVQITFDPVQTSYEDILNVFWRQIDPTNAEGQFCDKGGSYLSAIFYHDENQKKPAHYNRYRSGSGRDQFLKKVWGDSGH
ncbi:MAG: peptide-methionine (S)-S-oxide reductase [Elusimicrobia bacterium RIFCSPLOWO2_01_FULL_54_10]|nr:MAG: peptide-methionine (S)-S-oxide reductase [Elusimicrobia bacterium RIFCSPLOWO2_01_FULL_54_10]